MEPKDLKNSEELKSTEKLDAENSEMNLSSDEEKQVEETPQKVEKGQPEEEKTIASKTVDEVLQEPQKEEVKESGEVEKEVLEKVVAETEEPVVEESVEVKNKTEEKEPETEKEKAFVSDEEIEVQVSTDEKEEDIKPEPEKEPVKEAVEQAKPKVVAQKNGEDTKPDPKKEPVKEAVEKAKPKVVAHKKEKPDYSTYSQLELINAMREVLDNNDNHDIKGEIDTIKSAFYKNLNEDIEKQKKIFIDEGGSEEEFVAEKDPYEYDIKDLLKKFRNIRIEFNKKLELEKEENQKIKYQIIEDIKGLINNEESINKTFHDFKELQRKWRETGLVPQSKMKNLWNTYHFHVENFYDYIKINQELRDLDLKKNLEIKITLCEDAEELLVEPSIIKAFNSLQKLHEQWREIGPVPRESKDDIWERFKSATSKINKKHQDFFEGRKTEQKKNLEAKTALCEKVEEIIETEITNHREWDEKSRDLVQLQKIWRTVGFAPKQDNNKIYERFRTSCDKFFDAKREFYAKNKELQQNNLQLKIDLCVEAEALKDNTDWKKTTQDFINIQIKWKEVGPVPRKHSDAIWKRFRAACDFFFDKKGEHFSSIDTEQVDNLNLKEQLIEEVTSFKSTGDVNENLKALKAFQRRWTEAGHVPIKKKDEVQFKFREAINKLFDELNLDEEKRNLLKFRSKMSSYSESTRGQNKMWMERDKYVGKLKQLESDLVLLDNNIGFFAKSKNAESLIEDVKKKIEDSRQKIESLKKKIRVIDEMDTSE